MSKTLTQSAGTPVLKQTEAISNAAATKLFSDLIDRVGLQSDGEFDEIDIVRFFAKGLKNSAVYEANSLNIQGCVNEFKRHIS